MKACEKQWLVALGIWIFLVGLVKLVPWIVVDSGGKALSSFGVLVGVILLIVFAVLAISGIFLLVQLIDRKVKFWKFHNKRDTFIQRFFYWITNDD